MHYHGQETILFSTVKKVQSYEEHYQSDGYAILLIDMLQHGDLQHQHVYAWPYSAMAN
jgi:hypothetical protein